MITIDGSQVLSFSLQLRDVPKEARKELRRNILDATDVIVQTARSNASWSRRIPKAIRSRVLFGAQTSGVQIVVDSEKAPHARPYEGIGQRTLMFRHPVFGGDDWVEEPTRPFLRPALRQHEDDVVRGIQAAINSAFETLG